MKNILIILIAILGFINQNFAQSEHFGDLERIADAFLNEWKDEVIIHPSLLNNPDADFALKSEAMIKLKAIFTSRRDGYTLITLDESNFKCSTPRSAHDKIIIKDPNGSVMFRGTLIAMFNKVVIKVCDSPNLSFD